MKRPDLAGALLLLLCVACLSVGVDRVPALSRDEAWFGLFAMRLIGRGLYGLHAMNRYTTVLYSECVAAAFHLGGRSVFNLRLTGVVLNAAAVFAMWVHLRRRAGAEAGLFWALLASGSAYFEMKSRLASEVYAFQPLLLVGALIALDEGMPWALAAVCWLGVMNHIIFLCVPASLFALFGARLAWRREAAALPGLRASAAALSCCVALAAVMLATSDELWEAHPLLVLAYPLVPAAATAAALSLPWSAWRGLAKAAAGPRARRFLQGLTALGLLAFAIWHLVPVVQIFAGSVVFKRLFSWIPPLPLSALWHAWALLLCGGLAWFSVRAWHARGIPAHERTILLWPTAVAAVFIAFRHTSSLRYYSIPVWLSMAALAAAFPRLARADKRPVLLCAAAAALVTQALLWREIVQPGDRRPIEFKIGWRREDSWDFARKDRLYSDFDATNACIVVPEESSRAAGPVHFHRSELLNPCDQSLAFRIRRLPDAETPPFFAWSLEPVGPGSTH